MTADLVAALLVLAVLAVWLGAAGFARLRDPLDRMHCIAFVNATAGSALLVAGFLSDGATLRAFKIAFLVGVSLLAGAASSHAVGRALRQRAAAAEEGTGR